LNQAAAGSSETQILPGFEIASAGLSHNTSAVVVEQTPLEKPSTGFGLSFKFGRMKGAYSS